MPDESLHTENSCTAFFLNIIEDLQPVAFAFCINPIINITATTTGAAATAAITTRTAAATAAINYQTPTIFSFEIICSLLG
jgi:hypothetical protein